LLSDCELSDLEHTENLNSEYIGYAYEVFSERIVRYAANSLPKKSKANILKPYWTSDLCAARSRFNSLLDTICSPILINVLREDNVCRLWSMAKSHSKYYPIILD